jgi:hypothetical protein
VQLAPRRHSLLLDSPLAVRAASAGSPSPVAIDGRETSRLATYLGDELDPLGETSICSVGWASSTGGPRSFSAARRKSFRA